MESDQEREPDTSVCLLERDDDLPTTVIILAW